MVGESGLFTPDDIALLQNAGVQAVSFRICRFNFVQAFPLFCLEYSISSFYLVSYQAAEVQIGLSEAESWMEKSDLLECF